MSRGALLVRPRFRRVVAGTIGALLLLAGGARANWTASGTFRYRDRLQDLSGYTGVTQDKPIRSARVEIVRSPSTVLATTVTDASGNFTTSVTDNMTSTVFARVISQDNIATLAIRVQQTTSGTTLYAVASPTVPSHNPSTNTNFGIVVAVEGAGGEAFNILDVMLDGSDYLAQLIGTYPAMPCTTVWSSSSTTGTFFSGSSIRLLADEGWDDSVIAHEHGHFIDLNFSATNSPGGPHFLGDNNQDLRLAYGEGVATYHMAAGRKALGRPHPTYYIDCTAAAGAGNLNFSYELEGPNISAIGAGSEVTVTAALWDIVDDAATADDFPGDDDPLARPITDPWKVMSLYIPTATNISLEDFWDGWFSPSVMNGSLPEMQTTFGAHTCEFYSDLYEPDNSAAGVVTLPADGTPNHHSFYASGDVDFVRFLSPAPSTPFVIETANLFGDANTNLSVVDQNGTTILATNDDRNATDASSLLLWTAPASGGYYARLNHSADIGVYGSYDLRIIKGAPSSITWTDVANTAGVASTTGGRGGAWADYDGDNDVDLFVTNVAGNSWRLYRNNGNGTFTDVSGVAGIGGTGATGEMAVWGDYDNDGRPDIYVAAIGTNTLFHQNADHTFTSTGVAAGVNYSGAGSLGASWCDFDGDGWIDLFVGTIDAPDKLYKNMHNGTFTDVTATAGVGGTTEDTFGGVWGDYDLDGDADLFVHYDGSPDRLYRNNSDGTFTDVTPAIMQQTDVRSWGASWLDADHDGDFDLYVTCLGSPCRLYRNDGTSFTEIGGAAGVNAAGSQTGQVAMDFDNDLDEDIYVGAFDEPNLYYDNLTGTAWFNSGKANDNLQARSCTASDYDNDGDMDIYVVLSNGANLLYSNSGSVRPWVRLQFSSVQSNKSAIGTRVTLRSGGKRYVQQVTGGTGYLSQNDPRLLFSLGTLAGPDTFDIRWPSGAFQRVVGLTRNQTHTIVEMDQTGVPDAGGGVATALRLAPGRPNPFGSIVSVSYTLPQRGPVTLRVFDPQGRLVRTLLDDEREAGEWEASWDGRAESGAESPPGVYFLRIEAAGVVRNQRVVRVR